MERSGSKFSKPKVNLLIAMIFTILCAIISWAAGIKETRKDGKIQLDYWQGNTGDEVRIVQRFVDEYNESQSEVFVKLVTTPGATFNDIFTWSYLWGVDGWNKMWSFFNTYAVGQTASTQNPLFSGKSPGGIPTLRRSANNSPLYQTDYWKFVRELSETKNALIPKFPLFMKLRLELGRIEDYIMRGNKEPHEALAEVERDFQASLDDFYASIKNRDKE